MLEYVYQAIKLDLIRGYKMQILVKIKNVYGNEMVYPVCDTALTLASLTGKKTFSTQDIALIKTLGYQVNVEQKTL